MFIDLDEDILLHVTKLFQQYLNSRLKGYKSRDDDDKDVGDDGFNYNASMSLGWVGKYATIKANPNISIYANVW